ncbi:DUF6444 domain-containing protein [Streptomyces sp. NPDC096030]|uniref:DUF6444 domain-containing protein n=1 Tax=Streptomyces sp. NPDC096030 TaxID=3155423 RepID=UPI003316B58A
MTARAAELERRLGRNLGNSSMPPSEDAFSWLVKKAAPSGGRKRGRQPGAPGGGLGMAAGPDRTEEHFPAACGGCGSEQDVSDSIGFERRQVRGNPLVTVTVTEHRAHRCRCACGTVCRANARHGGRSAYVPVSRCPGSRGSFTAARGREPGRRFRRPDPGPAGDGPHPSCG